jgi:DnaK suppressor protein
MKKADLQTIKQKLEKEKTLLEEALQSFAQKDKKLDDDWDTLYPKANGGAGGQILEDAADQVEEYSNRLPVEFSLETRLKDINLALKKLQKGGYGKCEKCRKPISLKRLEVLPEAKTCEKCSCLGNSIN